MARLGSGMPNANISYRLGDFLVKFIIIILINLQRICDMLDIGMITSTSKEKIDS